VSNGDLTLSTSATGWYRSEEYKAPPGMASSVSAGNPLSTTTFLTAALTFGNNCNYHGVCLFLGNTYANRTNYGVDVRLQEVQSGVTITIASPAVLTYSSHGYTEGQVIAFTTTGALPTGITANNIYYVRNPSTHTFNISSTATGALINTSGTQSGTHSAWITRATSSRTQAQMNPHHTSSTYYFAGMYKFMFSSPYAVTTAASTWRLALLMSGGTTGSLNAYYEETGKTNMIRIGVTDFATGKPGASDCAVIKDIVTVDENWSLGNVEDVTNATYSMIVTDNAGWKVAQPATASWTLTCTGAMLLCANGYAQVGTSSVPFALTYPFSLTFSNPGGSKIYGIHNKIMPEVTMTANVGGQILFYGADPTNIIKIASTANSGQANIVVDTDVSAIWGATNTIDVLGGRYYSVGNANTTEHMTISSISGTTITCTGNLSYTHTSGYYVINRTQAKYPIYFGGFITSTAVATSGMNIVWNGVYSATGSTFAGGSYYAVTYNPTHVFSNSIFTYFYHTLSYGRTTAVTMTKCAIYLNGVNTSLPSSLANIFNLTMTDCCVYDAFSQNQQGFSISGTNVTLTNFQINNVAVGDTASSFTLNGANITLTNFRSNACGNAITINASAVTITNPITDYVGYSSYYLGTNVVKVRIINPTVAPNGGSVRLLYIVDQSYIYDTIISGQTGASSVDVTYRSTMIAGSQLGIHSYSSTNDHVNYLREGIITSTGDGLTDTTVHTSGTGKFGMRYEPISATSQTLSWSFTVPTGNIQSKTMTVAVWCKIASATYYAGTHQLPRLTLDYDNGTTAYAQASETTDWQQLFVTFTPTTTYGQITVTLSGRTDATTTNAYIYWDDMNLSYPPNYALDLGGMDNWANALPVTPPIALPLGAYAVANAVWESLLSSHKTAGSFGKACANTKLIPAVL